MIWSLAVAVLAGACAGAVVSMMRGDHQKIVRIVAAAIVFVIIYSAGRRWIVRPHEASAQMAEVPAFREIEKADPATYALIKNELVRAMDSGADHSAVQGRIHAAATLLVRKYIPRASDAAVRRYITVTVDEIEQLREKNPAVAAAVLFPKPGTFIDINPYLSDATKQEDMTALAELVRSGAAAQGPPGDAETDRADELLQDLIQPLLQKYGADIQMLSNPYAPDTDPQKLCAMIVELYRAVLALPEHDSAVVLRKLVTSA